MKLLPKPYLLAVAASLICVGLLTACNEQPATPTPAVTLPNADQVVKPTAVPATATPIPTPTQLVGLVPTAPRSGISFRKGEPPSLANFQGELATYAAQYSGPGSGGGAIGGGSGGSGPQRSGVYDVSSWHVSNNSNTIFLDTYNNQYLIVGLIVHNNGSASRAFSGLGLQLQFVGFGNAAAAPAAIVQSYLTSNHLNSSTTGTIYTALAPSTYKVLYAAFAIPASLTTVNQVNLISTTPAGLVVPLV